MYIGRYYFDKKKWIPAINRFKTVINDYETTIYAEEALHRLVEVHYTIGLKDEAKKYANFLDITINLQDGMNNLIVYLIKIIKKLIIEKRKKEVL